MNERQTDVQVLEGAAREAALAAAEPVVERLLAGFNAADYAAHAADFNEQLKTLYPENVFRQTHEMITGRIGRYRSRVADTVEKRGPYHVVVYHAAFEREADVKVTVSLMRYGERDLVAGLWFDSPKLRA